MKNIFRDTFDVEIGGVKLTGRLLNLGDWADLVEMFPEWETEDIQDLMAMPKYRLKALIAVIELGFKGLNDHVPEGELMRLFNMREMRDADSLSKIYKLILDDQGDDEADESDVAGKNLE